MSAAPILNLRDAPSIVAAAPRDGTARGLQSRLADAMQNFLLETAPDSGSEALKLLRRTFPHAPLADRVAALRAAARR